MPVLRELLTRFSFETDKKAVNDYHTNVAGMTKAAVRLAGVLGGAIGVKELFGMGVSAKQAEADLRRMAGTDFSKVRSGIAGVREELNSIREGAGDFLTTKEGDVLASRFLSKFKDSKLTAEQ